MNHQISPALRARIASLPKPLQPAAFAVARRGFDGTRALLQVYEGATASEKARAGLPMSAQEELALAYRRANEVRAKLGLPIQEAPVLDLTRCPKPLTADQAALVKESARNAHAMYGDKSI